MQCDIQGSMKSEVTDDEDVVVCLYIRTISVWSWFAPAWLYDPIIPLLIVEICASDLDVSLLYFDIFTNNQAKEAQTGSWLAGNARNIIKPKCFYNNLSIDWGWGWDLIYHSRILYSAEGQS